MSDRAYNKLANTFMLIGVASALLFDSGKLPRVFIGTIGVVAGVAAIALYFWNQHKGHAKEKASEEKVTTEQIPISLVSGSFGKWTNFAATNNDVDILYFAHHGASAEVALRDLRRVWLSYDADLRAIQAYRKETAKRLLRNYAVHARSLQWHLIRDANLSLMKPEVELSPNEVAACAVEIIRNLTLADGVEAWDYTFGPKGLRVSIKKGHAQSPVVSQEDFNFELLSSLTV